MIEAFYETWPLWAILVILGVACAGEEILAQYRKKLVDNPTL
jgi:hypothetical protein